MGRSKFSLVSLLWLLLATGCGDQEDPEPLTCDDECRDQVAARSLRETMKLAYNLTLQGNLVGLQVESTECPLGGSAELTGFATSVPEQGATRVELEYRFDGCAYLQRDDEADENYDVVIDGTVEQVGVIAVQPSANTALLIEAASLAVAGTVFDPPESYAESECAVQLAQNGNNLSGSWCGRELGFDL